MNLWMVRNTGHDIEAGCSSKPEEDRENMIVGLRKRKIEWTLQNTMTRHEGLKSDNRKG